MKDEKLRSVGLKVTTPRLMILEMLQQADPHHLSAEDIYQQLKDQSQDVGLATVYRVLTQFESAGLVKRHNFEGGHAVYELDQGEHHDHLVCVKCGAVREFVDEAIEKRQQEIATDAQFQITDHNLTIYGICPRCNNMGKNQ